MNKDNKNDSGEELKTEQTQPAKTELESEKAKVAAAIEEPTKPLTDRIASLEADIKAKDEELSSMKTQLSGFVSLAEEKDNAVTAYKTLVQKTNPLIPEEMITGVTVDDVNASLEKAHKVVSHIRTKVEEEITRNTVPAGAPGRTEPDISTMSTREKISYGLQKSRKGS